MKKKNIFLMVIGILLTPIILQAAENYKLPDTGITKCYDDKVEITCPAKGKTYYGQDAQYHGPVMAYRDNNDGTVSDLNTRLMWQQSDDGEERNWQQACDYCADLDLAGYSDWRIPTKFELYSIVDLGRYIPSINTDYFLDCKDSMYWSGSTGAGGGANAWGVDFGGGGVYDGYKTIGFPVRCVRLGP